MSLRKYSEDYKKKYIYLHEHEEYEKDLDFIAMIARDCGAWVEFYERENSILQAEIGWHKESLEWYEKKEKKSEYEKLDYLRISAELERKLDSVIYNNQQIPYWQKMADKWNEELVREKLRQGVEE